MNEKQRRFTMTVLGVMISGFSVGMFNFSMFGMDPFQVLTHGIWKHTNMGYGTFYAIVNLIILTVIFFLDKKKIGLGTLINIFLLGYAVEFSTLLFTSWVPNPNLVIRITSLLAAVVLMSFGSSLYFTGDLGVSTYDAIALFMSEKGIAKFKYCRIGTDLTCALVGFLFGATIGIGTLTTALLMGYMIAFFNKKVSIPFRYGKKIPVLDSNA